MLLFIFYFEEKKKGSQIGHFRPCEDLCALLS